VEKSLFEPEIAMQAAGVKIFESKAYTVFCKSFTSQIINDQ
jgi:hypothetical protein